MVANIAPGQPGKTMATLRSLDLLERLKHEIEAVTSEIG